jgi:hypothetical protein
MRKILIIIGALFMFTSCTTYKIASKPSKRKIRKAMKHSSWEYPLPKTSHAPNS